MHEQGKTKTNGFCPRFKSFISGIFGILLFVGVAIGIYVAAAVFQLAVGVVLVFLLFPAVTTVLSFYGINAILKRVLQRKTSRTISVVVAFVVFSSCVTFQIVTKRYTTSEVFLGKIYWSTMVPEEIRGSWFEVSDSVTVGSKRADIFEVGEQSLRTIRYHPYSDEPPNTNQYTGLAVERQGHSVTLHCPCEVFGKRIYRISLEDSGDFVHISEVTESIDYEKRGYFIGRFCRRRR